ncbi:MAG: gamma-glutamylcyclotransferase, partial [Verrucomicrobiota bacterium]
MPDPWELDPAALPLAVYGSLRRSTGRLAELGVADDLELLGECRLAGRLYDLGEFPGLLPGPGSVVGELYRFSRPRTLAILDDYEAFLPADPAGSLFVREPVQLLEPERLAWVYRYNRPAPAGAEVVSGDWLQHRAA